MTTRSKIMFMLLVSGSAAPAAMLTAAGASAQTTAPADTRITVPAMPMSAALTAIERQSGQRIEVDPDAVSTLTSRPVRGARGAVAAVRRAVSGTGLDVSRQADGSLMVAHDITVTARQDEAETGLLVRQTSTSERSGSSLREQPRNTTVISSKLIEQQQALTVFDALRNAGGVTVDLTAQQSGPGFSIRGFGAGGIINGLPGANNGGVAAGATQPIANIERIEVLKGPDALLAGADNLGGTVNLVTKKPFAGQLLTINALTGSYAQRRGTLDANTNLNLSGTLSARIVATAASADRNYGGYHGDEDYLFAPTVRFKNAGTDVVLGMSAGRQLFGATAFTLLNPATNQPFVQTTGNPLLSADQYTRITSTRYYGEATQKLAEGVTFVVRAQHEDQKLFLNNYTIFEVEDGLGNGFVSNSTAEQRGNADAVDGFLRFKGQMGPISTTIIAGMTGVWNDVTAYSSSQSTFDLINVLTARPTTPRPTVDSGNYRQTSKQFGQYLEYIGQAGPLRVVAGVRRNKTEAVTTYLFAPISIINSADAATPNFGAIVDVMKNISIYGNLIYGYTPIYSLNYQRQKLPDTRSRNIEAGVKLDLFNKHALLNASYFVLRQSNLAVADPQHPGFSLGVAGQQGKGVDISVSGILLPGWMLQANMTRTIYRFLTDSTLGNIVIAQPRDQYSIYTAYERKLLDGVGAGMGAGLFGRSSASIDQRGSYYVPPARQVDLNLFLKAGRFDANIGLRNLFDRRNYGTTYVPTYIPISEPRNWRLTLAYRFK